MTTRANVELIAPELATADSALWTLILNDVSTFGLSADAYGVDLERAERYLAAHLMTYAKNTGGGAISPSGGIVTSESAGRVSVSNTLITSLITQGRTRLDTTKYGVVLMQITMSKGNMAGAFAI